MLSTRRHFLRSSAAFAACAINPRLLADNSAQSDVCVYGATASGVAAALGAGDAGVRVIVVGPSRWLGGMSGGGLNAIDWGYKRTVGKMALRLLVEKDDVAMRELYKRAVTVWFIALSHRSCGRAYAVESRAHFV
jgi:NADPH-dependent 2,4-dienoyl-CoA reductase/sulfur reductase-like enzyme